MVCWRSSRSPTKRALMITRSCAGYQMLLRYEPNCVSVVRSPARRGASGRTSSRFRRSATSSSSRRSSSTSRRRRTRGSWSCPVGKINVGCSGGVLWFYCGRRGRTTTWARLTTGAYLRGCTRSRSTCEKCLACRMRTAARRRAEKPAAGAGAGARLLL